MYVTINITCLFYEMTWIQVNFTELIQTWRIFLLKYMCQINCPIKNMSSVMCQKASINGTDK